MEDGVAGTELHDEDVREQHNLIQYLKAKRDADKLESAQLSMEEEGSSAAAKKREREEGLVDLHFAFKEPQTTAIERPIATNRRVGRFHLEPQTKSFAWGLAAFAVGMGAV